MSEERKAEIANKISKANKMEIKIHNTELCGLQMVLKIKKSKNMKKFLKDIEKEE
jgi:hypothetical protein